MKEQVVVIILDVISIINQELEDKIPIKDREKSILFGNNSIIDSLIFVNLIVAVEEKIEEEFNTQVVLADEKAMSQRNSPFRTVETLANYIVKILGEK